MTEWSESPQMERLVDQTQVLQWSCYRAKILEKERVGNEIENCHLSNFAKNLVLELRGSLLRTKIVAQNVLERNPVEDLAMLMQDLGLHRRFHQC